MKKYYIAREKTGVLKVFNTIQDLKKEINNVTSWLSILAISAKDAIEKFPKMESKYSEIYDNNKLRHIIDFES